MSTITADVRSEKKCRVQLWGVLALQTSTEELDHDLRRDHHVVVGLVEQIVHYVL